MFDNCYTSYSRSHDEWHVWRYVKQKDEESWRPGGFSFTEVSHASRVMYRK